MGTKVKPTICDMVESIIPNRSKEWKPGITVDHPDGYRVKIIEGQFWGTYGLSNFWTWKRLDTGKIEEGYGW